MRVFVSHAGRDRAWAEWAAWQLEHAGWDIAVELDSWDWRAGDNFVARMNTALGTCDHMLALLSTAYFEPARWTGEEWMAALHLARSRPGFLVPVRLDDAPAPPLLASLLAPALYDIPRERARDVLLAALRPAGRPDHEPTLPGGLSQPRLPGVLPPVWGPVPSRNEAFTGRDDILVGLRADLLHADRSAVHALRGAGGGGKTRSRRSAHGGSRATTTPSGGSTQSSRTGSRSSTRRSRSRGGWWTQRRR